MGNALNVKKDNSYDSNKHLDEVKYFHVKPTKVKKKIRVLVALNSNKEKKSLRKAFNLKKFEINFAENGWFCLKKAHEAKLKNEPYDIVILGADLSVLDGFTLANKIRNLKLARIILITSNENFYTYEFDSVTVGCDAFIPYERLLEVIEDSTS